MFDVGQLGEKIRAFRQGMGLTQTELAKKINVSFQAVSSWEVGSTLPDIENICRLAEVFGVSVDSLLQKTARDGEEVMIAVNGGGSSTEFLLFGASGRVLTSFKLSGTNASVIGAESAAGIFCQGLELCLARHPKVSKVFIGNAGGMLDDIRDKLSERFPKMAFRILSDGVNALKSAKGDAAMICGTGSILLKEDKDGYKFVGGWGYRLGDPGSAYNIGREAVRAACLYEDGVTDDAMIYCLIKDKTDGLSVTREFDKMSVSQVASMADAVFEAYLGGNAAAKDILCREMKALASHVNAILPQGGKMIVCGKIMEARHNILLPILTQYTNPKIEFVLPKLPPVYGAAVACCELFGVKKGERFEELFRKDYLSST